MSGFVVLGGMATLYFLLAREAEGLLAGFGFVVAAVLYIVAVMNLVRPRK